MGRFSAGERETLRLAMDELIPRQPGHPAASDVGGLAYLETRAAEEEAFAAEMKRFIGALDESARARFGRPFARLDRDERIERLQAVESTGDFAAFRDAVYEAYYTRPEVWERIGYDFHSGVESRPNVARFDESLLASVRRLPKRYREVL